MCEAVSWCEGEGLISSVFLFMSKMACTKSTARLGEGGGSGAGGDETVSFEFGLSRVTASDLDTFAKNAWLERGSARPSKGKVVPLPEDDEVVVFKEFFLAGFRFPAHPLVLGVLKRFKLRFHQLNPSCFTKLSVYVWACHSQGVEPDLEGFIRTHCVHTQPRKVGEVDGKSVFGQFGVYTFCYRTGTEVPVQAQKNKWTANWHENWFYYKVAGGPEISGGLPLLGDITIDAMLTDASHAAMDALRALSRYQCARDLVQEFACV